jgi:hypothetical protein
MPAKTEQDRQLETELKLSDDQLAALKREASMKETSLADLVAKKLAPDPDPSSEEAGAPLLFSCPVEGCSTRARTLAEVCRVHGVHVV